MPIVRVTLVEGRTAEQKQAAARDITQAVATHCAVDPSHIYVFFEDVPGDQWIAGGKSVTERRREAGEA